MPMTERFFEQVASSIREMRGTVQNDLDRSYSVNGSIVLDQLTQHLADTFAAHYPSFKRDAFLMATHVPQGSGDLTDSACDDPGICSPTVNPIETKVRSDPPKAETRSFFTFAEVSEFDRHAGRYAQLSNETGIRIIGPFSPT